MVHRGGHLVSPRATGVPPRRDFGAAALRRRTGPELDGQDVGVETARSCRLEIDRWVLCHRQKRRFAVPQFVLSAEGDALNASYDARAGILEVEHAFVAAVNRMLEHAAEVVLFGSDAADRDADRSGLHETRVRFVVGGAQHRPVELDDSKVADVFRNWLGRVLEPPRVGVAERDSLSSTNSRFDWLGPPPPASKPVRQGIG
jgi:hypothetical protein